LGLLFTNLYEFARVIIYPIGIDLERFSGFSCCFLELFCVSYDFVSLIGLDSIRLGFCLGDLDAVESCAKHISSLRED